MGSHFRGALLACAITGSAAQAAQYVRQNAECYVRATQQDIDTPEFTLPLQLEAQLKVVFVEETGEVMRAERTEWVKTRLGGSEPIPAELPAKLNAAEFEAYTVGERNRHGMFRYKIRDLEHSDILQILRALGATDIDTDEPYQYSEITFSEDTQASSGSQRRPYAWPLELSFSTGWRTRNEHRFQMHLPPHVRSGLSFHLYFVCGGAGSS